VTQPRGELLSYDDIFGQWARLEADFHDVYGVDLEAVFRVKSWRWFMVRVDGLLSCDSRLHRFFREDEVTADGE
jgi:hypothetical protein